LIQAYCSTALSINNWTCQAVSSVSAPKVNTQQVKPDDPERTFMTKPTMLVVEDNPDHLELTLSALEDSDSSHSIVIATNGREALDYLFGEGVYAGRSTDEQPELVLLDLGMPEMNGLQVMQQMRNDPRTFFVPVVMLTSASEQSEAVLAFKGGLNSYVSKPLDSREFDDRLQQVREYWRASNFTPLTF
jgi:CheY-like chemotaxis protein